MKIFVQENAIENVVCQNGGRFCPGRDELRDRGPGRVSSIMCDSPANSSKHVTLQQVLSTWMIFDFYCLH